MLKERHFRLHLQVRVNIRMLVQRWYTLHLILHQPSFLNLWQEVEVELHIVDSYKYKKVQVTSIGEGRYQITDLAGREKPIIVGKDEIVKAVTGMLADMTTTKFEPKTVGVTVAGDYAFDDGTYTWTMKPKKGKEAW